MVFRGKVCFEILCFDICFEETFTLGSSVAAAVTPVASARGGAGRASSTDPPTCARAAAPTRGCVAAPATDAALPVVPPLGQLVWSQERAPLDLLLQRFEGAPLTPPETVRGHAARR